MTDEKRRKWPEWVSNLFPQPRPPRDRPFLKPGVAILNDPRFAQVAFDQDETDYGTRGMEAARIRKGIIAALKELRDTAVLDHPRDRPLQDLINNPLAVPVTGHINMMRLIQAVIDATADGEAHPDVIALPVQTLRDIEAQAQMDSNRLDSDLHGTRQPRKFMGIPVVVDPSLPDEAMAIRGEHTSYLIGVDAGSINCPMCQRAVLTPIEGSRTVECGACLHKIYIKLGDDQ